MSDREIFDCIRCGQPVYHTVNYCPHCGLELYPEPGDEEPELVASATGTRETRARHSLRRLVAVALLIPLLYLLLGPTLSTWLLGGAAAVIALLLLGRAIIRRTRRHAHYRRFLAQFDHKR